MENIDNLGKLSDIGYSDRRFRPKLLPGQVLVIAGRNYKTELLFIFREVWSFFTKRILNVRHNKILKGNMKISFN